MSNTTLNQKIEKACEASLDKFNKLGLKEYADTQAKLEYVLGSYRFDGNPVGLFDIGEQALSDLKKIKKDKPRSIAKKLIDDLEKAIEENNNLK